MRKENPITLIQNLRRSFNNLNELMANEPKKNSILGIKLIMDLLDESNNTESDTLKTLAHVKRVFCQITTGYNSDLFIWRDDFDKRKSANEELEKLKTEIWNILEEF